MGAGVVAAVAGLGVAVAVGAVPSPLSSGSGKTMQAATLAAPSSSASENLLQASASPLGSYAIAKMPTPTHKPKPTPTKTTATPTPTHTTATPTATQSTVTSGGGLTPQATKEYETPRGENQKAWSEAILTALGAPLTSANIVSIGYWMQNEAGSPPYGIVGANNPINVSQPCCGGVPIQDDGDGVTFLQSYPTVADGVEAIAQYLNRGNYTQILADLKAGAGLSDPNLADEISLYSGGGYSTIPDSYGQSQGAPLS
ncbi:MAG TPA: hypothetical protein VN714_34830 [Trebonia sp.]|nr:hypothetical protein [Trebonia sp.]